MRYIIKLGAENTVGRTPNTTRFYRDIRKYETLTKEEEYNLFHRMRDMTLSQKERDEARDYIIKCNQRLVIAAAKTFATTDTLLDFTNEANFGLMTAIEKFDPELGNKFVTFAVWYIKRALNNYRNGDNQIIKRPNISKTYHVLSKAKNRFIQENERLPTCEELRKFINSNYNKSISNKDDVMDIYCGSIDEPIDDDNDSAVGLVNDYNTVSACTNTSLEREQNEYDTFMINTLLQYLKPKEEKILRMLFGLYKDEYGYCKQYDALEISKEFNITTERVRQIKEGALRKLRGILNDLEKGKPIKTEKIKKHKSIY